MESINKIIGNNLLKLRKNAKLTQLELAEKFNYSDKSISKWETGESLPSIDVLFELTKFYGVTLDYLTKENATIETTETVEEQPENTKQKRYSTHLVITLMATMAVWLCVTALYVSLLLIGKINYPMCFLWAIPASCVVLIVFNSIWGHFKYLFSILTATVWSVLACLHIQVYVLGTNIWPVYLLGVPLQIGIMLWDALVKKPKIKRNYISTQE